MDLVYKTSQVKSIQAPNFIMHPAELKDFIDFEVKRIYYITDTTGATGAHCHLQENELFVLIQGTCTAVVDQGNGLEEIPMVKTILTMWVTTSGITSRTFQLMPSFSPSHLPTTTLTGATISKTMILI